jgi:antitoxin PrlF
MKIPADYTGTPMLSCEEAPDCSYGAGAALPGDALTIRPVGITFYENVIPERAMTMTTVTIKGQVTLPKDVREAVGLKPGDKVEVRATATGGVYIEKPGASRSYRERLEALARERSIRDITTDEFMEASRGEIPTVPAENRIRK